MKIPFHDVDRGYRSRVLFGAFAAVLSVIILFVLYKMIPGMKTAAAIVGHVAKPLILGLVLSYLLSPPVSFFESRFTKGRQQKKWARPAAVALMLLLAVSAVVGVIVLLVWMAAREITNIDLSTIQTFLQHIESSADGMLQTVQEFLASHNIEFPLITDFLSSGMKNLISGTTNAFSTLLFGILFAVYFLIDGKNISSYWLNVENVFIRKEVRDRLRVLGREADSCFSGYIRGQAIDAAIVAVVTSIVFILIDMPYGLVIGLLTGAGNMIPYVGPVLGYGSVLIINLINYNPAMLVSGLVILAVIMFLDGNVLNPRLLAGSIKVHPLLVVAALLTGGAAGGILGMLLAVPTAAFVKIQFDKLVAYRREHHPNV